MLSENPYQLVPLQLEHAHELSSIHAECFPLPWKEENFFDFLTNPVWDKSFGWAAANAERFLGFILAREAVDACEILTFAVRPDFQGQGIGCVLIDKLLRESLFPILLEVAVNNEKAIQLYHSRGFKILATRPDYYKNNDGSTTPAYLMKYES